MRCALLGYRAHSTPLTEQEITERHPWRPLPAKAARRPKGTRKVPLRTETFGETLPTETFVRNEPGDSTFNTGQN